jgi:cobaltochelatase CobN
LLRILFFIALLLVSPLGRAIPADDYLLVLTSQRNSETIAEAARLFYQAHPESNALRIQTVALGWREKW